MRSRVVALAAAVAMVLVATQVRARLDDRRPPRLPRIVCATELAAVCEAVDGEADVLVEPAGVTADRLMAAGDDLDVDGWVTPGPWGELVRRSRERAGKPGGLTPGRPVARARLAVVVWPERLAALRAACAGEVGWQCLVDAAASPTFKLGLPDARRDGLGLVALGGLAQALSPPDLREDDAFRSALDTLARAVPRPLPPLITVLAARGPSLADAYVVADTGAGRDLMAPVYPAPVVTADVVPSHAAGPRGRQAAGLLRDGRVVEALRAAGWDTSPGQAGSGLPDAGTLEALRGLWAEVAR